MEFLSTLFYFVIVIGVLVVVHEFGHFIAARLSGMRADVFSVGMGQRVFGWNKINGFTFGNIKIKTDTEHIDDPEAIELNGHTDYRLALFPIGGYVKISGMVDESFDTEFAGQEPKEYEFRSKNVFQKSIVISAGVIMNFLLSVLIVGGIAFFKGEAEYKTNRIGHVTENSIADKAGLQTGDQILEINSKPVSTWQELVLGLTTDDLGKERNIRIIRNGEPSMLTADGAAILEQMANEKELGIAPYGMRVVFGEPSSDGSALKAGLKNNDTVMTVGGSEIFNTNQFVDELQKYKSVPVEIAVRRAGGLATLNVTPNENGKIGIPIGVIYTGEFSIHKYGLFESISYGYTKTVDYIDLFFSSIGQIFEGNISLKQSVGGPIMIAKQAGKQAEQGISSFLLFMAMLSTTLAVINILPFPALDGGHLVFIIIEAIIRREVPIKVKMAIQQVGMVALLIFMAVVIYYDVVRTI
jgi:regulator of sigma E protease